MSFHLEIKESAKEDIIEAFLFYENIQTDLGKKLLDYLEKCLESLQNEPYIYQKKYKDFRQVLVKPFPYHVIYEVENSIIIVYKFVYGGRHSRKRYLKN